MISKLRSAGVAAVMAPDAPHNPTLHASSAELEIMHNPVVSACCADVQQAA
jgi:hypothetical protein